jgi:predicted TIM-barrel fold metal-dependent hydrolase
MNVIDSATWVGTRPEDDRPCDIPTLLAEMEHAGVSEALCAPYCAARYDARTGNAALVELCQQHPRLHPIAVVHPGMHVGVADEIRRCAADGMVGFRFLPALQGWSVESEPFVRALRAVADTGLPAAVEVGASGDATRLARSAPGLGIPLILAGIGYTTLGEAMALMERDAHLYLEACRLATPGVVEVLVQHVGAERLLFGSQAPLWEIPPTLRMVRESSIPETAKLAILRRNAKRVYNLGGRGGHA